MVRKDVNEQSPPIASTTERWYTTTPATGVGSTYESKEYRTFLLNLLADVFRAPQLNVEVLAKMYHSNVVLLVVTPFDYFLLVISISEREHTIPPSTAKFYSNTQLKIESMLVQKWWGKRLSGKKCSGVFTIRVGNYSRNTTGFHLYKNDKGYYEADLVLNKDEGNLWFYSILDRLHKWFSEREKGLIKYCRDKGLDPKENDLLKIMEHIISRIKELKNGRLEREKEEWNKIEPEHRAFIVAITSLLGTLGVKRTINNIRSTLKVLEREVFPPELKMPKDVSLVLKRTCKITNSNGEQIYVPNKRLANAAFEFLRNYFEKPEWFEKAKVKPIKVLDTITDRIEDCLPALVTHVFTKNGVIFKNCDPIYALCSYLLESHGIKYDPKSMSIFLYEFLKLPALLLPKRVLLKAWKVVYYTFYKRRRS